MTDRTTTEILRDDLPERLDRFPTPEEVSAIPGIPAHIYDAFLECLWDGERLTALQIVFNYLRGAYVDLGGDTSHPVYLSVALRSAQETIEDLRGDIGDLKRDVSHLRRRLSERV